MFLNLFILRLFFGLIRLVLWPFVLLERESADWPALFRLRIETDEIHERKTSRESGLLGETPGAVASRCRRGL